MKVLNARNAGSLVRLGTHSHYVEQACITAIRKQHVTGRDVSMDDTDVRTEIVIGLQQMQTILLLSIRSISKAQYFNRSVRRNPTVSDSRHVAFPGTATFG
jgi:hypothetical protein